MFIGFNSHTTTGGNKESFLKDFLVFLKNFFQNYQIIFEKCFHYIAEYTRLSVNTHTFFYKANAEEMQSVHDGLSKEHERLLTLHDQLTNDHEVLQSEHSYLKNGHKTLKNDFKQLQVQTKQHTLDL